MKRIARKSDGRRIFTAEFKREQIDRVLRGDLSLAELSRKVGIARSLLHRWKRLQIRTTRIAAAKVENLGPSRDSQSAEQQIRVLHRLVCRQLAQMDNLRAELDVLKIKLRSA